MLLNKYMVIYGLFLACSLGVGLLASVYGLMVLARRRTDDSTEKKRYLEKYLYLCTSAMFVGALVRMVMIPLWFFMLHSLIPSIPGAMCLAGVHLNVGTSAWAASSLKLMLPMLYFSWIFITHVDRRLPDQPFFKLRQILLAPLILLLFAEAFLDIKFLTGLKPTPVTCCTAIFDFDTQGVPEILTETHWYFVVLFLCALAAQVLLLIPRQPARWVHLVRTVLSVVLFFAVIPALHTRLSPLILDSPFHHCIFCLVENNLMVLFGFTLIMAAVYLSFAQGLTAFTANSILDSLNYGRRSKTTIYILYAAGTCLTAIPAIVHLFSDKGAF